MSATGQLMVGFESTIESLMARAATHHGRGEWTQAEQAYLEIIGQDPGHGQALYLLGTLKAQDGDLKNAKLYLVRSITVSPEHLHARVNLGNVLQRLGESDAAAGQYSHVLGNDPENADACFGLGKLEAGRGNDDRAHELLEKALAVRPEFPQASLHLGRLLRRQGDLPAALDCFETALRQAPGMRHVYRDLGGTLQRLGRPQASLAAWQRYVSAFPNEAAGWNNLGNVQRLLVMLDEAADSYRRALELDPSQAEISNNLGNVMKTLGQFEEALACYRRAIQLNPEFVQAYSNLLLCMNYVPDMDEQALFDEHLRCAAMYPRHSAGNQRNGNDPDPDRRLRVAYMSPDFRKHAVTAFFEPLLAAHDRDRFEFTLYAQLIHGDDTTVRLQSMADSWCITVGMSDAELAERMQADGIDILVDLAGHSARNRLGVMALAPVPVQVSWLGYPNTTGLSEVDYRLTDSVADPEGGSDIYTESLLRLPPGLTCYLPPKMTPDCGPLPALQRKNVTFGSLNNLVKLNDAVIALWSRVLHAIPGSRLLLFRDMLRGAVAQRVRDDFGVHGIGSDRLLLMHELPDGQDYLNVYGSIDIALDTFPWNGHVTSCEALWMGVPVITMRGGQGQRGRLAASVLAQVGLDSLVAESEDDFISIACGLAADQDELASLRLGLRGRVHSSALCDHNAHARAVEQCYRTAWHRWCAGETRGDI